MTKRKISTFERLNSGRMNRKERRKPALQVAAAYPGSASSTPMRQVLTQARRAISWPCRRTGIRRRCVNSVAGRRHCANGSMAGLVPHRNRRPAVHRRLPDRGLRHSRTARHTGGAGECAGHKERTGTQDRRAGVSVADEAACAGTAAGLLRSGAEHGMRTHRVESPQPAWKKQPARCSICRRR